MDKLQIEPKQSKFWRPLEKCDYGNSIFSFSSYVRQSKFLYFFLKRLYFFPYFDNCLSLIIYFPSSAVQSPNNCFSIFVYINSLNFDMKLIETTKNMRKN